MTCLHPQCRGYPPLPPLPPRPSEYTVHQGRNRKKDICTGC